MLIILVEIVAKLCPSFIITFEFNQFECVCYTNIC